MKYLLFYVFLILSVFSEMAVTTFAQSVKSTVCPDPLRNSADSKDVVITICNHEGGMAPLIQPRLYFRLFSDGRAEFETEPLYDEKAGEANFVLLLKKFQVAREDVELIGRLIGQADFENADSEYPRCRIWTDSSLKSTIFTNLKGREKKIVVNNFTARDEDNKTHYPPSLLALLEKISELRTKADTERFKQTGPEIVNYAGALEVEKYYRANAGVGKSQNLILTEPPKVPFHHVASIEWTNEQKFLAAPGGQIIFRVISKEVKKFRRNLWVTIYVCEILKVEQGR